MLPDFIGTAEVTVPKDGPPPHVRIEMKPRPERPRAEADEPHWLVGTWIQQRTDKPGRDEPSYYIMRLNADGSWVNASLWGTPEKPVKVTVTNRGRKWTVIQRRAIWSDWRLEAQEPGPGRAYSLRLWLDDGSRVGLREMVRKDADTILFYAFDSILMKSEYRRVDPKTKAVLEGFLRDANPATPPGGPVSNPVEIEILPGKE